VKRFGGEFVRAGTIIVISAPQVPPGKERAARLERHAIHDHRGHVNSEHKNKQRFSGERISGGREGAAAAAKN